MLDRLVRFADTRGCRRQNLLRYFGDADAPRGCEACESCKGSRAPAPEEVGATASRRKPAPAASQDEGPYDEQVFEKLRALRTELARETRVPPYVVFHDATLRELARALPRDEKSFLLVKGAGPSRWQRYGERVVAITRDGTARDAPAVRDAPPVVREPEPQRDLRFQPRTPSPMSRPSGPAMEPRPAWSCGDCALPERPSATSVRACGAAQPTWHPSSRTARGRGRRST